MIRRTRHFISHMRVCVCVRMCMRACVCYNVIKIRTSKIKRVPLEKKKKKKKRLGSEKRPLRCFMVSVDVPGSLNCCKYLNGLHIDSFLNATTLKPLNAVISPELFAF